MVDGQSELRARPEETDRSGATIQKQGCPLPASNARPVRMSEYVRVRALRGATCFRAQRI